VWHQSRSTATRTALFFAARASMRSTREEAPYEAAASHPSTHNENMCKSCMRAQDECHGRRCHSQQSAMMDFPHATQRHSDTTSGDARPHGGRAEQCCKGPQRKRRARRHRDSRVDAGAKVYIRSGPPPMDLTLAPSLPWARPCVARVVGVRVAVACGVHRCVLHGIVN
jgi:hypothetical protein